jgi:trimeric autotransporter adhesin
MKFLSTLKLPFAHLRNGHFKNLILCLLVILSSAFVAQAKVVYTLSGNVLSSFGITAPGTSLGSVVITGVTAGQTLEGIDFRPLTGELYAIGYNQNNGETRLYTINLTTGFATVVGAAPVMLQPNMGEVNFDFNPTVDRIRVTSSSKANYRLHPVTGAIAATDGALAYAVGDTYAGTNPFITACAYSNSFVASSSTTLYNYDAALNILTSQNPPNNGTLNTIGLTGLNVSTDDVVDMDIYFDKSTQTNFSVLSVQNAVTQTTLLYSINLSNGTVLPFTTLPLSVSIDDIALEIERGIPPTITGQLLYALTANNNLVSFDSDSPGILRTVVAVTGITAGQTIEGVDFRPATGELYAIGYAQATGEARLHTINLVTGVATAIGVGPVTLQPNMGEVNFDFNPTVDRIRVTGSNGANYRLHPVTGIIVATDGALNYALGDINVGINPKVAAAAYTNSYLATSATTLYTYDAALNVITTQIPPNNGVLNTIGISGIIVDPLNPAVDMDIAFNSISQTNTAFVSATALTAGASSLYTLNLNSGALTNTGLIGISTQVNDIAAFIKPQVVPTIVTGHLVYAVTANNNLILFDSDAPDIIRSLIAVTGITAGQTIEGIDYRPATGELYAIGYVQNTGEARLYVINPVSGIATPIGSGTIALQPNMGEVNFDFNPTVDRIRVTGSNNANYRLHPVTGAIAAVDGALAYATGDFNVGIDPLIAAAAYTNSYIGASTTTLYNYDAALNIITTQIPPNNGTLNTVGVTGIAIDAVNPAVDMDVFFDAAAQANIALLSATSILANGSVLYRLNLNTGEVTIIDTIGVATKVNDIAIVIDRFVPAAITGKLVYAITGNNNLISFDSDLPSIIRTITPLTGVFATQTFAGLDFRPATGELFALGYNNTSGMARLYTVDPITGVSTAVGVDSFLLQPAMAPVSFDFNPTVDRIRVVGANGANYRLNPITGTVAATDMTLAYAAGDANAAAMPAIGAVAYTNSFGGSTSTTLFDYDYKLNVLTTQLPPNNGTLNTIGNTGIVVNATMPTIDMDVHYGYNGGTNTGYLSANTGTNANDQFFKLNINTGAATLVGSIGLGIPVRNIAVLPDPAPPLVTYSFKANLTGHQQVFPVATTGTGEVTATLTGGTLVVTGSFSGLSNPVNFGIAGGAHIHSGYAGQNGGIEFPLVTLPNLDSTGGIFLAALNTFQLTPAQVQALQARSFYVNIHSFIFASGEIRGQLLPLSDDYYSTNLFGSNQTPSVLSNGNGALALELHSDTLVVSGSFDNLDGDFAADIAGGAHLHIGLPGSTGGVTILLNATTDADLHGGVFAAVNNTFVLNAEQKAALTAHELYANIHTETNESGEIRGQITASAHSVFRAHLSGANQYPFVTSMGSGQVLAELKGTSLVVTGSFGHLEGVVDTNILGGAHIHLGLAGSSGAVLIELEATFNADGKGGAFYAADNTFTIDAATVQALLHRELYVNIHTSKYPGGEIRGQLLLESQAAFTAYLTGSQSIPDVSVGGNGAVTAEISGNRLTLSGSFTELGSPINLAIVDGSHIHSGLPGTNGAVQFPLVATLDSDLKGGIYTAGQNTFTLTAEQRAMLMARGLYVNIHTLLNPTGEIRGNLLAEAAAYFFSPMSGASQTTPVDVEANGMLVLEVSDKKIVAVGSFSGLEHDFDPSIADGAHLHQNFAGSNGDVKIVLDVDADADLRGGAFQAANNAYTVPSEFIDTIRKRMIYANIHTTGNAGGEIRGQLMPMAASYFHTSLAGINQVPAVGTSGSGGLKLELNGNLLTCTGSFNDLVGQFDANIAGGAHIHNATTGNAGGIALDLKTTVDTGLQSGVFEADQNTFILSANQIDLLRTSEWYANIHTTTNPGGEIRGQVLAEINLFPDVPTVTLPLPGATINVQGLPADLLTINWTPSIDPDGDKVIYVWQVALDANFSTILYMQGTDINPLTTITYGELDALLMANSVPLGTTVTVFHRVVATDGSNFTAGVATQVKLTRGIVSGTDELLANTFAVTIQPSITFGQPVTVQIDAQERSESQLLITNSLGQVIAKQQMSLNQGMQQYLLPFDTYAPGVYYLSLQTDKGVLPAMRVLKQ